MRPTTQNVQALDRRQGKRYVTVKNFGKAAVFAAVLFGAITIRSELRRPTNGDYGRLFGRELTKVETPPAQRVTVVAEATPVPESLSADPMLVAPAAREQYLGGETAAATLVPVQNDFSVRTPPLQQREGAVMIWGDSSGVAIATATTERPRPLSGGIFRQ